MASKTIAIPSHIIAAGMDGNYFTNVYNTGVGASITHVGNNMVISDISVTNVRNVLGIFPTQISDLCLSTTINQHSYYKPNGSPPYRLGDFAGYNEDARPTTYFYNKSVTTWTATKTSSYVIAMGFDLRCGEIPPAGSRSWSYVRIKVVINDTLNSRTLTFYSPLQAVSYSMSSFIASYTDSSNVSIQGTATITAEYMDSTNTVKYSDIEDTYPTVTVNIAGYYIPLNAVDFSSNGPSGDVRWYYVMADTPPYNALTYISYGTSTKFHTLLDSWNTTQDLICAITTAGNKIPDPHPSYPTNNWALVGCVIYNSAAGTYRVYEVAETEGGDVMEDTWRLDSNMGFAYYLNYKKALIAYPTVVADFS